MTTREIIKNSDYRYGKFLALLYLTCALRLVNINCSDTNATQGWDELPRIIETIKTPVFEDNDFIITKFGAVGDGKTNCTEALKAAIDACHQGGGGRVVVPKGVYLTGAIHLRTNINLYISKNATLLFSSDFEAYLPVVYTRFEGVECMNYSPLIYAYNEENIAITGSGILDGQAGITNWWEWKGRPEYGWEEGEPNGDIDNVKLLNMAEDGIVVEDRVFGEGHYLRTNFIQPYKCKNVLIDSVTILRSPMWTIHPVLCENVTVQNVTVNSHGPNNDGCNPESSKDVLIKNCYFDTGDDCIAIKSGRNTDGRRVNISSENIIVQNCTMRDGHGGVVIGSEMSGNVHNVFVEDCIMDSPNLERALRIKTNSQRGGIVENIYMRNCIIGEVSDAVIRINFHYGEGDTGNYVPIARNIFLSNLKSTRSRYAIYLEGYKRSPISNLKIEDCDFRGVLEPNKISYCSNLVLRNVYINGKNFSYPN